MNSDTVSGWERLAGITSGIAVLAWLGTLFMWVAQLFSWLFAAHVPHPSVVGIARTVAHWFGFTHHTWVDRPYAGIAVYTALKHAYITSSCLVIAALFSTISVLIIIHDDRSHALPALDDMLPPTGQAGPERNGRII